jgi:hypothetical protein
MITRWYVAVVMRHYTSDLFNEGSQQMAHHAAPVAAPDAPLMLQAHSIAPLLEDPAASHRYEVEAVIQKVLSNQGLSLDLDTSGLLGRALLGRNLVQQNVRSFQHPWFECR